MITSVHTDSLRRPLQIQARIIWALIMREILTRYGRHNIGFMWVFVEPMMFTGGVLTVWTIVGHHTQLPVIPFTVTGYSMVLVWRNAISRCCNSVEPNRTLLHHRNVRIIDLFISRLLLELGGASVSLMTLAGILISAGLMPLPDDVLNMIIGWGLLSWWAIAAGLIVGTVCSLSEMADRIWHIFTYLFLPMSGSFYMVDWLPKRVQTLAEWVPTVQCSEIFREGYFGAAVHAHYSLLYIVSLNFVLSLFGLIAVRRMATMVEGG